MIIIYVNNTHIFMFYHVRISVAHLSLHSIHSQPDSKRYTQPANLHTFFVVARFLYHSFLNYLLLHKENRALALQGRQYFLFFCKTTSTIHVKLNETHDDQLSALHILFNDVSVAVPWCLFAIFCPVR